MSGVIEVIVVILAIRVWRGFGWRVYKVVGGDLSLNRAYANYQALQAAVVVSCELWLMAVFLAHAAACLHGTLGLGLGGAFVALGALEVFAVRLESGSIVVLALLAHAILACYAVVLLATGLARGSSGGARGGEDAPTTACGAPAWLCAHAHDRSMHVLRELAIAACVLAVCAHVLVCVLSARATGSFGRGLRERAFAGSSRRKRGVRARFAIDQPFTNFAADEVAGEDSGGFTDELPPANERGALPPASLTGVEPLVASQAVWPPRDARDDENSSQPNANDEQGAEIRPARWPPSDTGNENEDAE